MASVTPTEVRKVRQEEQLTVPDLAKMANITAPTLRKFEGTDDDKSDQVFSSTTLLKLTRVARRLQRKIEARKIKEKAKANAKELLKKYPTLSEKKDPPFKGRVKVSNDFDDEPVLEPKKNGDALVFTIGGRLVEAIIAFVKGATNG